MAGNFRGIQFLQKAHIQRFRNLIFMDERSRVAPPTLSVRLRLLLHVCHGSNIGRKSCETPASNLSYLYLAEIEKWERVAYVASIV